nr:hypothetical protein [uncultured Pseudodesulfovibrio sp.]
MNILEMCIEVLRENIKPMHYKDIAVEIVNRYNLNKNQYISIDSLAGKISSSLSAHIRTKKNKAKISKIPGKKKDTFKQGMYRAKRKRKTNSIQPLPSVGTGYTGKAGEFGVLSELLFRGYNASIMTVDEGIDVVATKNNKYFHIQVKTANSNKSNKFLYTVAKNSFTAHHDASTYYIFILRRYLNDFWRSEFIVISSVILQTYILQNYIKDAESMSITLKVENEKIFLNNKENVTWALNKFDL